jgi:hypothetical protein
LTRKKTVTIAKAAANPRVAAAFLRDPHTVTL